MAVYGKGAQAPFLFVKIIFEQRLTRCVLVCIFIGVTNHTGHTMTQETNFDQLNREMQDRLKWAQFNAQRANESRDQFLLRVASMLLRGSDQSMWAGDEHFCTWDVANELERMAFEMEA